MVIERIEIIQADITMQNAEAIVNAANTTLLGGGGVDGAIHRQAGPKLLEECRKLKGCPTGSAKITLGYNLPAKWVIHTVGPVWHGGKNMEEEELSDCYKNSFALLEKHNIKTIAFPSISTGAYGFPIEKACRIAITETKIFLSRNKTVEKVTFVCFSKPDYDMYKQALGKA